MLLRSARNILTAKTAEVNTEPPALRLGRTVRGSLASGGRVDNNSRGSLGPLVQRRFQLAQLVSQPGQLLAHQLPSGCGDLCRMRCIGLHLGQLLAGALQFLDNLGFEVQRNGKPG